MVTADGDVDRYDKGVTEQEIFAELISVSHLRVNTACACTVDTSWIPRMTLLRTHHPVLFSQANRPHGS